MDFRGEELPDSTLAQAAAYVVLEHVLDNEGNVEVTAEASSIEESRLVIESPKQDLDEIIEQLKDQFKNMRDDANDTGNALARWENEGGALRSKWIGRQDMLHNFDDIDVGIRTKTTVLIHHQKLGHIFSKSEPVKNARDD